MWLHNGFRCGVRDLMLYTRFIMEPKDILWNFKSVEEHLEPFGSHRIFSSLTSIYTAKKWLVWDSKTRDQDFHNLLIASLNGLNQLQFFHASCSFLPCGVVLQSYRFMSWIKPTLWMFGCWRIAVKRVFFFDLGKTFFF